MVTNVKSKLIQRSINIFSFEEIKNLTEDELLILWSLLMKTKFFSVLKSYSNFLFVITFIITLIFILNKNFVIEVNIKKKL